MHTFLSNSQFSPDPQGTSLQADLEAPRVDTRLEEQDARALLAAYLDEQIEALDAGQQDFDIDWAVFEELAQFFEDEEAARVSPPACFSHALARC